MTFRDVSLTPIPLSFKIKGNPEEDAVLCTPDKTYAIRSVVLSNSVLVVTPGPPTVDEESGQEREVAVIRDQLNEILELVPSIPKLHKLDTLLRGAEYGEEHEDEESIESESESRLPVSDVTGSDVIRNS